MHVTWSRFEVDDDRWDFWSVVKTPKPNKITSARWEDYSIGLHVNYLWNAVPETEIYESKNWKFEVHQSKVNGVPLLLTAHVGDKVKNLLESWSTMQKDHWIFFDVFWSEWMKELIDYYCLWTPITKISDLLLPENRDYLNWLYNQYDEKLSTDTTATTRSFTAHNILVDYEWNPHFIDTDNRPLKLLHPINLVWNILTNMALKDLWLISQKKKLDL